ncbi:MAG: ATP-grasp domain-containing protein [Clostridium sp.]|jgi:carbamoyl-phosphate synthase large subunit|uniref:ATP-grasp domain-containing protein n=1 Tax=Clostridium sp. TaxID=1506 RepID=UPI0025C38174|nr:ATP-grasp domain-containing protein [Clostridium sp.]MCH3964320.1 ATP-grasp domain-containing protein [Clostridium sp.]MCI1715495.1 ATP-grasp domain-containing protein [Clostridium sp.]MCI1799713.1 ATP-grasp domain-containing protein [Clostridium sp.]MCI1813679.1 ATP-grasp domain-containing protein [Clostridium sp.]MCI1870526.1 ATP-grasp domain-containing protein [Clostridium sp.]
MKILITSIGKRVQLIKYLKRSCTVIGTDAGDMAPAIDFADKFYKIPRIADREYVNSLIDICRKEKVDMIVPLHEYEFYKLCSSRDKFDEAGTILLLSSRNIIDICQDKLNTYKFFSVNGIGTPRTYSKEEILFIINHNTNLIKFPLIVKPINGMGSMNVHKVNSIDELKFFVEYVKDPIVQEYVDGKEYTVDVLCDLTGNIISVVPRERLEVRDGEVSKSRTAMDRNIIEETFRVVQCLSKSKAAGGGCSVIGPYTIQCRVNGSRNIKFIEINPRFGGGVPLTFEAGVNYGKYFNMMVSGEKIQPIIGKFRELTMLRYDEAVFLN